MRMKISEIKINPGRRDIQQRNVEELARSIAAVGLMNPITCHTFRHAFAT